MIYEVKLMFKEQAVKSVKCLEKKTIQYWIDFWKNLYQEKFASKKLVVQIYPVPDENEMDKIIFVHVDNLEIISV